ncbi:Na+/H+ antiporter subunit E [Halorhodospira halochloris]|uniref:Na(+) H(+) antiporter subunit E n=1 Tax=Halorhodospira halochloris TaxID=1052 RepID=A0A125T2Q8_HALHR|nr:Na+/H+ antiporter subunit E [Halorhodospira halochloris]MBK1652131.1 Na+/H+ antiporter subunit E [Halorhodospira halochloris]MCG5530559.1 Na+/H+ antiporter subunit E [Halorhodospira halochloris]BAU58451.1 Na(+) H(+) antiporter subunit E [Halorhodospira halochloris]
MIPFALNVVLAVIWLVLTANVTAPNALFGLILGYIAIAMMQVQFPIFAGYAQRVPRFIRFVFFYIWEMIKANARVAYDVLTPEWGIRPGVIAIPLEAHTDGEITVLANLISLTPGTLSLDVSTDRQVLYIHAMYIYDEVELLEEIKELERRVLEVMR